MSIVIRSDNKTTRRRYSLPIRWRRDARYSEAVFEEIVVREEEALRVGADGGDVYNEGTCIEGLC